MINWQEMGQLHVVQKLKKIVGKWFGLELAYSNEHYKIQSNIFDKNYTFENSFLKMQLSLNYGHEYLIQDIERITDLLYKGHQSSALFDTFMPGVKLLAAKIRIEESPCGIVWVYPFVLDNFDARDEEILKEKLRELGAKEAQILESCHGLRKLNSQEREYLQDILDVMAEDVVTYHQEILKREERILELNSEIGSKYRYHSMIGKSRKIQQIYRLLEKISRSETTVLIQGENGTGKELVAKAIHYNSSRKDNVFLAQNCSAFNDNLLDSELFGHVRGAFTGAIRDKKGLFEMANGGTLFLDEIGDTSLAMQVKLLRVLQEGIFLPVGASVPKKVNVRIIAATNKDLKEMIERNEFREDLYYRINVINIVLPSLRERREDIPLLAEHFLSKKCMEAGYQRKVLSKKCLERMLDFPWPGNVRELENEIERLVVLAAEDRTITPELLSGRIKDFGAVTVPQTSSGIKMKGNLKDATEELEILMIREGLKRCDHNKSKLAKELGISRAALIMKVEKYGLDKKKNLVEVG